MPTQTTVMQFSLEEIATAMARVASDRGDKAFEGGYQISVTVNNTVNALGLVNKRDVKWPIPQMIYGYLKPSEKSGKARIAGENLSDVATWLHSFLDRNLSKFNYEAPAEKVELTEPPEEDLTDVSNVAGLEPDDEFEGDEHDNVSHHGSATELEPETENTETE
jgi:hypothetical protein